MYCYMLTWSEFKMIMNVSGKSEGQWLSWLDTIVKMYALGDKSDLRGSKQEAGDKVHGTS